MHFLANLASTTKQNSENLSVWSAAPRVTKMDRLMLEQRASASEGTQISQLFKRVRLHVKENPIHLSQEHEGVDASKEDGVLTTGQRLSIGRRDSLNNLRKRRSSDMIDDLADNLRDKCHCGYDSEN